MMRTLKGGICQCIKYVEKHPREKCNYTETERGGNRSPSDATEEKSLKLFSLQRTSKALFILRCMKVSRVFDLQAHNVLRVRHIVSLKLC